MSDASACRGYVWMWPIHQVLGQLLSGFRVQVYFFSESPTAPALAPPDGFGFLAQLVPGAVFVNHMDTQATLYHLANADMVITSGTHSPTHPPAARPGLPA